MTDCARLSDCRILARIDAASNAGGWSENAFSESLKDPSCAVLVFRREEDGDPEGFIVCEYQGDLLAVDEIAVCPERRRRGTATELLNAAASEGIRHGCTEMTLEVRSGNTGAVAFYEKNGFQIAGIRKGLYCDPPDDALVMMKQLSQ